MVVGYWAVFLVQRTSWQMFSWELSGNLYEIYFLKDLWKPALESKQMVVVQWTPCCISNEPVFPQKSIFWLWLLYLQLPISKCYCGTSCCCNNQKQPPEVFYKKGVLKNFAKFTGKSLHQSLFFNKVVGFRPETLLKKRLWHRSFPVNFAKF